MINPSRFHRVISTLPSPSKLALAAFVTFFCLPVTISVGQGGGKGQNPNPKAAALPQTPITAATSPEGAPEMTVGDVSAFLDGVMPLQLRREDVAGAVIVVVKDGKILFAKGYGYANVEKRIPVSPDGTLFRPGSISKLFNWTSIMQQVEQGKLDF